MLTRDNINEIYRKYKKAPASIDELDLATLFDETAINHDILVDPDENTITFGSIETTSPFHTLGLSRINAILGFEEWIAIVLPAAIVFLNRTSPKVAIDIKSSTTGLAKRITRLFGASIAC